MSHSIVGRLIAKDLHVHRAIILGSVVAGVLSLAVLPWSRIAFFVGGVSYMVVFIVLNTVLVSISVVGERKEKVAHFLLSLPVSTAQYAVAKLASSLVGYAAPAVLLTGAAVVLLAATPLPDGFIPVVVILATHFLMYFCILLAVGLVSDSGLWITSVIVVGNVSVTFIFQIVVMLPSVRPNLATEQAVWGTDVIALAVLDLVLAVAALGIGFLIHSRKKEFI